MTDEYYKKIMTKLGMPNNRSLLVVLQQVAHEAAVEALQPYTTTGPEGKKKIPVARKAVRKFLSQERQKAVLIDGIPPAQAKCIELTNRFEMIVGHDRENLCGAFSEAIEWGRKDEKENG